MSSSPARQEDSGSLRRAHLYRAWLACCRGDAVGRRRHGTPARRDWRSRRRSAPDRRAAGSHRRRIGRRRGEVDRGGGRCPIWLGAQRRYLCGRDARRGADEPVGADVRHQHLRSGRAHQGAPAFHAQSRARPHHPGVQRGRRARNARDRTVFRGQGRPRTLGRIDGGRSRLVRYRRHHPGHRDLRHRDHHRRGHDGQPRPRRALRGATTAPWTSAGGP